MNTLFADQTGALFHEKVFSRNRYRCIEISQPIYFFVQQYISTLCALSLVGASVLFGSPDSARFDCGLGSHACADIRVYLMARLADGWNTTYLLRGLFSFPGGDSIQFLQHRSSAAWFTVEDQ